MQCGPFLCAPDGRKICKKDIAKAAEWGKYGKYIWLCESEYQRAE